MTDRPRPIRVAHVITKMAVGGAQESAITTCVELRPPSFEQVIFSGAEVDAEGSLADDARRQGVDVRLAPGLVMAIRPLGDLRAAWNLARLLREWRPEIVHTHSSKGGFVGRLAARLARVPHVVHSVHGWSFNDDMGPVLRSTIVGVERVSARITDALVVESSTDLPKGLGRKIGRAHQYALIRNGIDLARFHAPPTDVAATRRSLGAAEGGALVGTVGRLADQKDPLLMVDAFAKVLVDVPDATFAWVGDGPLREATAQRAAALGIEDRFHLVGLRRDVPDVVASFDVFALSSRWEGLPRTITEAMAACTPVVATSVDGTVEAIDDGRTGLLVPSGDADALARSIVAVLRDPAARSRMGAAGRERAAAFSRETMSRDLADLYRVLVDGDPVPRSHRPLKIVHVITGLGYGGAERQLQALVQHAGPGVEHEVIALTGLGPVGRELLDRGIAVTALGLEASRPDLRQVLALRRHLRRSGADVVQTWLYHGDLLGGVAARSVGLPVIWSVRMTWMEEERTKASTMAVAKLCARLSARIPHAIVFNSERGRSSHGVHGYSLGRSLVIGNGVDSSMFHPDLAGGDRLRSRLGLGADVPLVGAVGRNDPQKGYDVLLDAMARIDVSGAHLVLAGAGCDESNLELVAAVRRTGLTDRTHLLGPQPDVAAVLTGLDLLVSASRYGESVPNVVLEALACRTPVVATDVGDLSALCSPRGMTTVPAGDGRALSRAIAAALRTPVRPAPLVLPDHFTVATRYEELYAEVADRSQRCRTR